MNLREAIENLDKIDEGAKFSFVSHRESVDNIIRENKRVGQILARDKKDYAAAFNKDAAKLQKALGVSAKLARTFWEDWHAEF